MATHMIRIHCEPPRGEAEPAINNWVSNYREWTADPVTHELIETTAGLNGSGTTYVRGDWRFIDEGEAATNILEDLSARLQSLQGGLWHRLWYHVCGHEEDNGGACSWDETLEWGTVPNDIPTCEVTN